MVVLLLVDDDTEVIGLELDVIQLGIELFDLAAGLDAIIFLPQPLNFCLDGSGIDLGICDAVQFIQPPQYLTIGQRDDLIISPSLGDGQRQLPLRFA